MRDTAACVCHPPKRHGRKACLPLSIFFALALCLSGCALFSDPPPPPQAEFDIQEQEFGVITHINHAAAMDKERHRGDLALTVELEDGRIIVVVQPQDDVYTAGDRVRVLRDSKGLVRAQVVQQN